MRIIPSVVISPVICLAALALSACVPATRPVAPPPVRVAPPPPRPAPAPLPADWRDWPVAPGTWSYRRDPRGTLALFGPNGGAALVTLRCMADTRTVYLSRAGTAPAPLVIRTSTASRTLPVQPTGGQPPFVTTALTATDPLLDAIAFSRGRFAVEQGGGAPLVIPAWPEIGRVIEDCRD
jgi:hypothetical protein